MDKGALVTVCGLCSKGRIDPLTALHQSAEYQQHLARLMELVLAPTLQTLRTARVQSQWRQQQLRDLRDILHHQSHSGEFPFSQPHITHNDLSINPEACHNLSSLLPP